MIEKVHIEFLKCLPGASDCLPQKTAIFACRFSGDHSVWHANCRPSPADWLCLLPRQGRFEPQSPPANLAEWLNNLVIAIQREAYEPVWRGRVIAFDAQRLELALPYQRAEVLKASIQWALRFLLVWGNPAEKSSYLPPLSRRYRRWLDEVQSRGLSPNSQLFAMSAFARDWPVCVELGMVKIGWGKHRQRLDSSFTGNTSMIAARFARSKSLLISLLRQAHLPVPSSVCVNSIEQARQVVAELGWPVVVKPDSQDQGLAVTTGICDEQRLQRAFEAAASYGPNAVIVQNHVLGHDYRLLTVHGRLLVAARRIHGGVVGDGRQTVAQLLRQQNQDPRRGRGRQSLLIQFELDQEALDCLATQQLTAMSIPAKGQNVSLRFTANISNGGTAEDVTEIVHADNRQLAERASRLLGLDIAGVDLICPDITRSWREVGGVICEINAQPGFRPHWLADPSRDINGEVLERLFANASPRIPTAAITGTNGKTTTARMLHRIWMVAGKRAGVCTTQGTWIGDELVNTLNLSGFPGATLILDDPSVEAAIFEMPRKGLIYFGHPCDGYDVGALLNIQQDHIGLDGIETLGQMAALKAQVLQRSRKALVVNADDIRCMQILDDRLHEKRLILVSYEGENSQIKAHIEKGGEAVLRGEGDGASAIVFAHGEHRIPVISLHSIPATMNGLIRCNEINALFAAALAWAQGLDLGHIRDGLAAFENSGDHNPGRYNFLAGYPFTFILDFAHNPDGVSKLCDFVEDLKTRVGSCPRCHLISISVGNSHRDHIEPCARRLARVFDTFSLSNDADEVSWSPDYSSDHPGAMMLGLFREALEKEGIPGQLVHCFPATKENWLTAIANAMQHGLDCAKSGDILVALADAPMALKVLAENVTR